MIGRSLLHYEIVEKLGEGGMGMVYKARDTHLDRYVALKLLPTSDPDRKSRFVREAKAASALNHPGIITIYDASSAEGTDFIAMEYVPGVTLADRIRSGLELAEALDHAIEIADALNRAHGAGIIHRDLKPANVMISLEGHVKVVDFGLAKLTEVPASEEKTETVTELGLVVGTVAYMSPEQAQGRQVDSRGDIFSFGAVLYEMITGRRPFQGTTTLETLSAILREEPHAMPAATPADLANVVRLCLKKDPQRRFQHMADVKVALLELRARLESGAFFPDHQLPAIPRRRKVVAITAVLILVSAAGGLSLWLRRSPELTTMTPMVRLTSDSGLTTHPSLSPDGKLVAYASDRASGDNLDIWVQQVDGGSPLRLTSDPANEYEPSFSPNGNRIVFHSERDRGGIYSTSALGGEARLIAKGGRNPRFSPDSERIAFVTGVGGLGGGTQGELYLVASAGGTTQRLVFGTTGAASPTWSPDGRWILFATGLYRPDDWGIVPADAGSEPAVITLSLAELKKTAAIADVIPHQWIMPNRILFSAKSGDSSHLFEVALSPPGALANKWSLDPTPKRLTFGTAVDQGPSVASAGLGTGARRLAFASLVPTENLWALDMDTDHPKLVDRALRLAHESGFHIFPRMSRDGSKLVFISHAAHNDEVWLLDFSTGKKSLLSSTISRKFKSGITPDGAHVYYGDNPSEKTYSISSSGGAPEELTEQGSWPWEWSVHHNRLLAFWQQGKASVKAAIWNLETRKRSTFLERAGTDLYEFRWSPDHRWIVFAAHRAGRMEVFVVPFSGDQGPDASTWIPITDGSSWEDKLDWSPDGNWIYSLSDRDSFPCIWAYHLDARKARKGAPVPVYHSHGARLALRNANLVSMNVTVARNRIVFNQGELTGNIWLTNLAPR